MRHCSICDSNLAVERLRCMTCGLTYEGRFGVPRLARLTPEQQELAEQIVVAAGNLKEVAGRLEVSYPTLRKRIDSLVLALRSLRAQDETETRALLDQVEAGAMTAEEAARLISEINGGA